MLNLTNVYVKLAFYAFDNFHYSFNTPFVESNTLFLNLISFKHNNLQGTLIDSL